MRTKKMSSIDDNPPKTVREVGIYMSDLFKSINSINKNIQSINDKLDKTISREEFEELKQDVYGIHCFIDGIKNKIVWAFISMLAMMILAQYGINEFFRLK